MVHGFGCSSFIIDHHHYVQCCVWCWACSLSLLGKSCKFCRVGTQDLTVLTIISNDEEKTEKREERSSLSLSCGGRMGDTKQYYIIEWKMTKNETKDACTYTNLPRIISSLCTTRESSACSACTGGGGDSGNNANTNMIPPSEIGQHQQHQQQRRRHLVLHFDINETILVGDDAGGDTVEDCINKIIAKSAFVQIPKEQDSDSGSGSGSDRATEETESTMVVPTVRTVKPVNTSKVIPTHWWDGTPLSAPTDSEVGTNSNSNSNSNSKSNSSSINSNSNSNDELKVDQEQEKQGHPPAPPPLYTGWEWPKDTCPYYRTAYKKNAKTFTNTFASNSKNGKHGNGNIYRPLYEHLKKQFVISSDNHTNNTDNRNVSENVSQSKSQPPPTSQSHPFQRMIPSFFQTLVRLKEEHISYTLVLRTFGSDLEDIAFAINDFARGKHPLFPNFIEPRLYLGQDNLYKGRWRRKKKEDHENNEIVEECSGGDTDPHRGTANDNTSAVFDLYSWDYNDDNVNIGGDTGGNSGQNPIAIASGDDEVLRIIEQSTVCGIQDDYHFWDDNNNAPWAGKPVWIHNTTSLALPSSSSSLSSLPEQKERISSPSDYHHYYHHLFFDDNIHNDPNDSIVAVRTLHKNMSESDINENTNNIANDSLNLNSSVAVSENKWVSLSGLQTIEQQGKHVVRVPTVEAILNQDWFIQQIKSAQVKVDEICH